MRCSNDQMSTRDCDVRPNRLLSPWLWEFLLTIAIYGFRLIIYPPVNPDIWKWQDSIMIKLKIRKYLLLSYQTTLFVFIFPLTHGVHNSKIVRSYSLVTGYKIGCQIQLTANFNWSSGCLLKQLLFFLLIAKQKGSLDS